MLRARLPFHDDAWRENRTRITQLEHERAIEYLGMYYTSIGTLLSENRLYQELDDYSSDTDVEEIFEALGTNLGPIAGIPANGKREW